MGRPHVVTGRGWQGDHVKQAGPLRPGWWAGGLNLRERLPAPALSPAERELARVRDWRATHAAWSVAEFELRLAGDGLDAATLAVLLAEAPSQLAARTVRPQWADYVERAIADAAAAPGPVPHAWQAALASGLEPLLSVVRTQLAGQVPSLDRDVAVGQLVAQLGTRLVRLAVRTLVLELNRARAQGRLAGATPADRFTDFVRQLGTGGLAELLQRYPVLARVLGEACRHAAAAGRELLDRFAADRAEIVRALLGGHDPGPLVEVTTGGDAHRRGRSVAVLGFADGSRVVYKPRPLDLHRHFNDLLDWLNQAAPELGLRTVGVLCRDGYGWLEFIEHRPCADHDEVRRFYYRQGALLALLYVLDGTDMHYENLVACGDQPVFVDVETLLHPTLAQPTPVGPDPAAQALAASVHRTALLPLMLVGDHGMADLSGLGGDRDTVAPNVGIGFAEPGTDAMRLVRRPVTMPGGHNRPLVGDREVEPTQYRPALLSGFRCAYDAVAANRDDLTGPDGLLSSCANDEIRLITRPTQLYASLLDESTHPDALRDALERDRLLDLLWTDSLDNPTRRRLVPHEVADLWAGDIPMFTTRPGTRDVWAADGSLLADLLDAPSLDAATAKIAGLGEVDRHAQEWLITAALATRQATVSHHSGEATRGQLTAVVPDPQKLLAAACGIADELVATALTGAGRVNWLGLELVDDVHWAVLPQGAGLSSGYTGTALFLAQLADLTGATRYSELAWGALRPLPLLLESLDRDLATAAAVGCGFHGLGGICYGLARLSTLFGTAGELRGWLDSAVLLAARLADLTETTDAELAGSATTGGGPGVVAPANFAEGEAGGLAAMLAVYAETGSRPARHLAVRYADRLVEMVDGQRLGHDAGFARGPAGVGWALLRAADVLDGRYRAAGATALALDPRPVITDRPDYGWCGGLAGAVVATAELGPSSLDRQIEALAVRPPLRDLSLCHGELGAVEPLIRLARAGHEVSAAALRRRAGLVLGAVEQRGAGCGTPGGVSTPGLLTGLAGIGYGLVRLGFDTVPSVLLLEPLPPPDGGL